MSRVSRQRGQPLFALAGLITLWTVGRVAAWSIVTPLSLIQAAEFRSAHGPSEAQMDHMGLAPRLQAELAASQPPQAVSPGWAPPMIAPAAPLPILTPETAVTLAPEPYAAAAQITPVPAAIPSNAMIAGGHQLMYLAALNNIQIPSALIPRVHPIPVQNGSVNRWSADGWLLLRRDIGPASLAAIGGSYGASQVGAVLRYRIDRTSPLKPSLYIRASSALNGSREQEAAFGFSARPISALPLVALAEARVSRSAAGTRLRPAAMVVTELPAVKLPLGMKGETYIQAGYVGGYAASTFIDGQARIDRKLFSLGTAEMRAGGAAWGGAQKGASRLDVGPSASLSFRLENTASARLSADWRFRVAGKAAPASGPALTLSAGF